MQKHDISDYDRHDTFVGCSSATTQNTSAEKTAVGFCHCLPDVCCDTKEAAYERRATPSKDVCEGDNNEVGISEGENSSTGLHKL